MGGSVGSGVDSVIEEAIGWMSFILQKLEGCGTLNRRAYPLILLPTSEP